MEKLLEIGEIGILQNIPVEMTFLSKENAILKRKICSQKLHKQILVCGVIILISYIIWLEYKNMISGYKDHPDS